MAPKKTTASVQVLLLTRDAEVKEVNLPTIDGLTTNVAIKALLKGKDKPEVIGTYPYKGHTLFAFGYTSGKAGTENKHELPPPHDSILCFGDIIILSSKDANTWTTPVPFKMADYETFYTRAFGGFTDINSDDEGGEDIAEIEVDVDVEVEEDVDEVDEEGEAEVDEGEEDVIEQGGEGEEGEIEVDVIIPVRVTKKKKNAATSQTLTGGAAQVYASYLHVSVTDELMPESFDLPYNEASLQKNRKKVLQAVRKLFKNMLDDSETVSLERCIYNGTLREAGQRYIGKAWSHNPFAEMYEMFAKHISANFLPSAYVNNTELYHRYKSGEITFKDISEMDTYQLFEERWKESFMQQEVREKRQLEGNKSMATDQFLCMRCHKRECTYYEMQTRSADEPMTIFITCLNCGKHWRQ